MLYLNSQRLRIGFCALFLLLFISSSYCQTGKNRIYNKIEQKQLTNSFDKSYELIDLNPIKAAKHLDVLEDANYYTLSTSAIQNLRSERPELISLPIQVNEKEINLLLFKKEIQSETYNLSTSDGTPKQILSDKVFYHGVIEGEGQSLATLSIFDDEMVIHFSDKKGNYHIKRDSEDQYVGYYDTDFKEVKPFSCGNDSLDQNLEFSNDVTSENRSIGGCVEIYFELDFAVYQDHGFNTVATENWMLAVFNEIAIVYDNEGIEISASEIFIHTSSDPYASENNIFNILFDFADNVQDNYNGRLAHFVSGRPLGGGVAWLDVLCSTYNSFSSTGPYGVSAGVNTNTTPFPNFSWNVMVMAHELGHNFGSPHTHACAWGPSGNDQIDDCGNQVDPNNAGSCYNSGNPIIPSGTGGTMMSYCHAVGGVGINFNNGFGTEPGALILSEFNNASCTTGTNCAGIEPPVNDDCGTAAVLTIGTSCSLETFTNVGATSSGVGPGLDCESAGAELDVWFEITVPASGEVSVMTGDVAGGLDDMMMQTYDGNCNNLNPLECHDDINTNAGNRHALIEHTGLTPGTTIYARVISWNSQTSGVFGICAWDPNPIVAISITCPTDIDVSETGTAPCVRNVNWNPATASGGCSTLTITESIPSGSAFNNGTTTVVITAEDTCGNSESCSFDVTVTCDSPSGPCPFFNTQNAVPIPSDFYQASNLVQSKGRVPANGDVHFQAGNSVNLNVGFEVKKGADFDAIISGCN